MKKFLTILLVFSPLLFVKGLTLTPVEGETRTAIISKNVSPSDLINIKAKNTNLVVEAWEQDHVEITVTIRYDGKMTDKMTDFLENFQSHVESKIEKNANELFINSNLDEPNKVQIGSKRVGIIVGYSEDELRLDYKIKAPSGNRYEINNSYRDVTLIGSFERMKITQYSGELRADNINNAEINMKYGSATFGDIGKASVELYEQKLKALKIGELEIDAKYSDLEINESQIVEATAYESDFTFNRVAELSGNFKYGEIKINENLNKAELEFYEMEIEANQAGTIEFNQSKYSKINLDQVKALNFRESYEDEIRVGQLGKFKSLASKYGKHEIRILQGNFELNAYEDDVEIEKLSSLAKLIFIRGKYINASLGMSNRSFTLKSDVKYGKVKYEESQVNVKKYIKENDRLEVEIVSKDDNQNTAQLTVEGYEIDIEIK